MNHRTGAASIITAEQIDSEVGLLNRLKSRVTGSAEHEELIGHIESQLRESGLAVNSDSLFFSSWTSVAGEAASLRVEGRLHRISSIVPYSGTTSPAGIEAELVLLGSLMPTWENARDKIAVVEVSNFRVPMRGPIGTWGDDPSWPTTANPVIAATIAGTRLAQARRAGVKAVIFAWKNISDECADDQYLPFTFDYQDIPAVFVSGAAGRSVVEAAAAGETGSLVVPYVVTPGATTRTLSAVVEGTHAPDETVLMVTHTDGVNAIEENGHIALVAMARAAARNPPERTSVFVFTSGHLRIPAFTSHGQATQRFLTDHPELWAGGPGQRHAVAGLAVEHLGAVEFSDDPVNNLQRPTGLLEPELLYATTPQLADLARENWEFAPGSIRRISKPSPLIHFGEGEPLLHAGIPAVSLVTAPLYLLAQRKGDEVELVDKEALHRQVDSFERLYRRLTSLQTTDFGRTRKPGPMRMIAGVLILASATAARAVARLFDRRL